MSTLIVITDDVIRRDEVSCWIAVLAAGVEKLHIRKPNASKEELEGLLSEVPVEWRKKLVIHYQPELAVKFDLGGLHVSYRDYLNNFNRKDAKTQSGNNTPLHNVPVSCSVHNWDEAKVVIDTCAYCFISPVFDSISKMGYMANDELREVPEELRNGKIYALGGINLCNAVEAISNGYYGVVALGYIWSGREETGRKAKELIESMNNKKALI